MFCESRHYCFLTCGKHQHLKCQLAGDTPHTLRGATLHPTSPIGAKFLAAFLVAF